MINYKVFQDKNSTALALADELANGLISRNSESTTIAISGGSTPFIMFDILADKYAADINWANVHFFWVDERCVKPTDSESNYLNTMNSLFSKIEIPDENIHRVLGENAPDGEATRYQQEIEKYLKFENGWPQFDYVLLGMGDDGHTASIFPPQMNLFEKEKVAAVAQNPYSGQNRITLTGKVINNAAKIYFLVTGAAKAPIFKKINEQQEGFLSFPAAHISTNNNQTIWFIDKDVLNSL